MVSRSVRSHLRAGVAPQRAARGKPCAVVCGAAAGSSRTGSSRSRSLAETPRPLLLDSRSPREVQPGEQEQKESKKGEEVKGEGKEEEEKRRDKWGE